VLIDANGNIILVKELKTNDQYLNLPGGGRKSLESAQETAIRECREELGLEVNTNSLTFLGNMFLGQIIFPLFFLKLHQKATFDQEGFEVQIYEWQTFLGMVASINPELALEIGNKVNKLWWKNSWRKTIRNRRFFFFLKNNLFKSSKTVWGRCLLAQNWTSKKQRPHRAWRRQLTSTSKCFSQACRKTSLKRFLHHPRHPATHALWHSRRVLLGRIGN